MCSLSASEGVTINLLYLVCRQIQSLVHQASQQQQPQYKLLADVIAKTQGILDVVSWVNRGHSADMISGVRMQQLSINGSGVPASSCHYAISVHCCREGRFVAEMVLKVIINASDADRKLCEEQWVKIQRQRRQSMALKRAMVGDLITVIRRASEDVEQGKATAGAGLRLWSQELKHACSTLQQAGNKASLCTAGGEVTVADANVSLWSLKQLIEALSQVGSQAQ